MSGLELIHFQPEDILFVEGERTYFFYMIKEGQVEIYRDNEDGTRVVLASVEAGQSLGEFAMIDKMPRSASARALSEVVAVKISEEAYSKLLDELPSWAQAMMEGLVTRLRQANEIIRKTDAIDEETKTGFDISQFDLDGNTGINFDFDFSELSDSEKKGD